MSITILSLEKEFNIYYANSKSCLSKNIISEVENIWIKEQSTGKKTLFNGQILSVVNISESDLIVSKTEYKYFVAQQVRPELYEDLKIRPLAVSGLLACQEGVVIGRRAKSMMQDANLWELIPSGGVDPEKTDLKTNVPYIGQTFLELQEEVGIGRERILEMKPFCLLEDTITHVIDIGIIIKTSLHGNEILDHHNRFGSNEYDKLKVVKWSELLHTGSTNRSDFVNLSTAMIHIYKESEV